MSFKSWFESRERELQFAERSSGKWCPSKWHAQQWDGRRSGVACNPSQLTKSLKQEAIKTDQSAVSTSTLRLSIRLAPSSQTACHGNPSPLTSIVIHSRQVWNHHFDTLPLLLELSCKRCGVTAWRPSTAFRNPHSYLLCLHAVRRQPKLYSSINNWKRDDFCNNIF